MQDGQVKEAAKACASFAYHNPRNTHIKVNINFYNGQPQVTEEDKIPMETKLYVSEKYSSTTRYLKYQPYSCIYL